jgi:hypothetical protein
MSFRLGQLDRNGGFRPSQNDESWTASMPSNGKATVDLGDGYRLEINEASSQILIINENTNETTNIWGDPHIDWNNDGRTDADFWTTTTFQLENGTKITIDTTPWNGNADMYVAERVTITKGDNAVVIDGVSQNTLGDLSISMSQDGRLVDGLTRDGFRVVENANGEGWINPATGRLATQRDFDVTRPGQAPTFDPSFSQAVSAFLLFGVLTGVFLGAAVQDAVEARGDRPGLGAADLGRRWRDVV